MKNIEKMKKAPSKHQMVSMMYTCAGLVGLKSENAAFSLALEGFLASSVELRQCRERASDVLISRKPRFFVGFRRFSVVGAWILTRKSAKMTLL